MANYLLIKKSQIHACTSVPFYHKTKDQSLRVYKREGECLDLGRAHIISHPNLYIRAQDKTKVLEELRHNLNLKLIKSMGSGGLKDVKIALCNIVNEALTPGQEAMMDALPETMDILLNQSDRNRQAMSYLSTIASTSRMLVDHTVNVAALTLQYCLFHNLSEKTTQRLTLAALVHDVGFSRLGNHLIETRDRLTDQEYEEYRSHTYMGHDMLHNNENFGEEIARVALEHHERIDGSGYPNYTSHISTDSQLIGLIDSYESLTYRDKSFRRAKRPFNSLQLIKDEVLKGKFDRRLFKRFASCLVR